MGDRMAYKVLIDCEQWSIQSQRVFFGDANWSSSRLETISGRRQVQKLLLFSTRAFGGVGWGQLRGSSARVGEVNMTDFDQATDQQGLADASNETSKHERYRCTIAVLLDSTTWVVLSTNVAMFPTGKFTSHNIFASKIPLCLWVWT